jgi:protein KRI1
MCECCQFKLSDENDYYSMEEEGTGVLLVLCEECIEKEEKRESYTRVRATRVNPTTLLDTNPDRLKEMIGDADIQNLVDEYYNLDFEDVIAGGIKTRFKYVDTEP